MIPLAKRLVKIEAGIMAFRDAFHRDEDQDTAEGVTLGELARDLAKVTGDVAFLEGRMAEIERRRDLGQPLDRILGLAATLAETFVTEEGLAGLAALVGQTKTAPAGTVFDFDFRDLGADKGGTCCPPGGPCQ